MIRFTSLGTDKQGRDIVALYREGCPLKISVGLNLLNVLRSKLEFLESERLPGERVEKVAA